MATSTTTTAADGERERFEHLYHTWQRETMLSSNLSATFAHPAFAEIVGMGHAAVPWILEVVHQGDRHLATALMEILGFDAAEGLGRGADIIDAWTQWGHERGLLGAPDGPPPRVLGGPFTVAQLRELLDMLPDDAPVVVSCESLGEGMLIEARNVHLTSGVIHNPLPKSWWWSPAAGSDGDVLARIA